MERAVPPPPAGKPGFWWAFEKEPWKRIAKEMEAAAAQRQVDDAVVATMTFMAAGASFAGLDADRGQ